MKKLIFLGSCHIYNIIVEINRNPTINYGSQLVVKVVHVKPDMKDFTMSLPESILRLLNADFVIKVQNIVRYWKNLSNCGEVPVATTGHILKLEYAR